MDRRTLRALVALNVVLLVALVLIGLTPAPAQGQYSRAEYIMVSGKVVGRTQQSAVYILDLSNARIAAVMFNSSNDKFEEIDRISLRPERRNDDDDD